MNVVFMGTPDFAVPALQGLIQAGHTISGVFCQPDRPKGRGHKMAFPPVKEEALKHNLPVFQPESVKTQEALEILQELNPDCIVVVAYGKLLPREILDLPRYGCVNIHGSLLPNYRGAAPIQWAVLNGDKVTGLTTMQLNEGMDTGDILLQKTMEIPEDITAGELFDALSALGGPIIAETLAGLEQGSITPVPQDHTKATHAPMLEKAMSVIDWQKSAWEIKNLIRGLNPWPCAKITVGDKTLKVHKATLAGKTNGAPGQVQKGEGLVVACGDGNALRLNVIQPEGSRAMADQDYLRGHAIQVGTQL